MIDEEFLALQELLWLMSHAEDEIVVDTEGRMTFRARLPVDTSGWRVVYGSMEDKK